MRGQFWCKFGFCSSRKVWVMRGMGYEGYGLREVWVKRGSTVVVKTSFLHSPSSLSTTSSSTSHSSESSLSLFS